MPNPTMTPSNLQVLRSYDGEGNLQRVIKPAAAQELIFKNTGGGGIPAGRVCSINSSGEAELGITGSRVPMWLFRQTDRPSGGWQGEAVATATDMTWSDGIEGLEIATTEYITTGNTYALNGFVSSLMSNHSSLTTDALRAASAGKVFTLDVVYGAHAVIGVVSQVPGSYGVTSDGQKRFGRNYLVLYTLYRPAIAGLLTGTSTSVAAL